MTNKESYEDGLALGYLYAEHDLFDHVPTNEAELRAEAVEARDDVPSWRAFKLGIVRGYRNATRRQLAGKWGT